MQPDWNGVLLAENEDTIAQDGNRYLSADSVHRAYPSGAASPIVGPGTFRHRVRVTQVDVGEPDSKTSCLAWLLRR
jgi:hypothetical protein